jgi:antitoxin CcdA
MICQSLGVRIRGLDTGGEILVWPNNAADSHGRCRRCPSNRVTHATAKYRFPKPVQRLAAGSALVTLNQPHVILRLDLHAHILCAFACGSFTMGAKKAVNVSIQSELLDAARAEDINLSATLEAALADQLRIRRRDRWQTENEAAIEAYNRDVDENRSFGDHARSF